MIDLKLNDDDDIHFDDDMNLVDDVQEVIQAVGITLRTRMGEFFADEEMGLDREYILGKNYNAQYAAAAITGAIKQDTRVTSVGDVTLTKGENRSLTATVTFTVDATQTVEMEVSVDA